MVDRHFKRGLCKLKRLGQAMPKFDNMSAEHYSVDTDLPLSNFSHCHIGILHHFDQLSELLQVMSDADAAKKIAKEAMDYFHLGMKAHHQEEERELFPAVLSSAIPGDTTWRPWDCLCTCGMCRIFQVIFKLRTRYASDARYG